VIGVVFERQGVGLRRGERGSQCVSAPVCPQPDRIHATTSRPTNSVLPILLATPLPNTGRNRKRTMARTRRNRTDYGAPVCWSTVAALSPFIVLLSPITWGFAPLPPCGAHALTARSANNEEAINIEADFRAMVAFPSSWFPKVPRICCAGSDRAALQVVLG
jgi:hypothetical protein